MAYGYASSHSTSANLTVYIIRRMLAILRNKLRFDPLATESDIPVRAGHTVARWLLPVDIGVATTAIAEFGTASQVATLTWSTYEATVSTYGVYSLISDMADASWLPQARNKVAEIFAYGANKTIDTLHRNNADDTTNFIVSNETSSGTGTLATTETMTLQDVAVVGGYFERADAEGFDHLRGDFALIIHGEPWQDMSTHVEPGGATTGVRISWYDAMRSTTYGQQMLQKYEKGSYAGVSVQVSNNIAQATLTNTVTAYKNIGLAKDGIGKCNLDMRNFRIIEIPASQVDKTDPLGLYGTVGWKARLAHRALDVTRAVVLYTAK